ncbi:MAG: ABC transporter permease [Christensenella sp.]
MSTKTGAKELTVKKGGKFSQLIAKPEMTAALALIVLCVIMCIARPETFPTVKNIFNMMRQFSLIAILAVGMGLIIITTGIDLSVGSVIAASAAFGTYIARANEGTPAIVVLLLILGFGAGMGFANGLLVSKVGLPPFIATLGTMSIGSGIALLITNGSPISYPETWISAFGGGYIGPVPISVIVMAVIVIIGVIFANNTMTGRNIYAVGNSPQAAKLSGIPVDRVLTLVYVIEGLLAGVCALLLVGQMNSADPSYGKGYEMDVIAAAVIGGISMSGGEGSIVGTIIGAALMGVLKTTFVLLAVSGYWQTVILGLIIIGAVALDSVRKKRAAR